MPDHERYSDKVEPHLFTTLLGALTAYVVREKGLSCQWLPFPRWHSTYFRLRPALIMLQGLSHMPQSSVQRKQHSPAQRRMNSRCFLLHRIGDRHFPASWHISTPAA